MPLAPGGDHHRMINGGGYGWEIRDQPAQHRLTLDFVQGFPGMRLRNRSRDNGHLQRRLQGRLWHMILRGQGRKIQLNPVGNKPRT